MNWVPDRYRALARLLRSSALEGEVEEELTQHFVQLVEDLRASGLDDQDAAREAERRFGDRGRYEAEVRAQVRERSRARRRRERTAGLLTDLRAAARALCKRPGFTASVLATLGLSLAATAVTLTLVDEVLLSPLPYPSSDELVVVRHPVPGFEDGAEWGLSVAGYFYFGGNAEMLEELGVWTGTHVNLAGEQGAERALAAQSSASLLRTLGATPLIGRSLSDSDNLPDAPPVAVLSHPLWTQRYGADSDIVGQTMMVNSRPVEIVGVLQPEFSHPLLPALLWLPLQLDESARAFNSHYLSAIARIKPGVDAETASRELQGLTARLPEVFPEAYSPGFMERYGFHIAARPLKDDVVGEAKRVLWIVFAVSLLVLFVAAANSAGMFLVRADARRHEMAVRQSLGANRLRLFWHGASEAVLIATTATVAALILGTLVLRILGALELDSLPRTTPTWVSARPLLVVLGLAGLVAAAISVLTRILPAAPTVALRGGGAAGPGRPRRALRDVMMIGQVAAALVIASGAGLLYRSASNLGRVDTGLETENAWFAEVALPALRYRSYQDVSLFLEELARRLEADPRIRRVGFTNQPPLSGIDGCSLVFVENRPPGSDERPPCVATPMASAGYFDALGVPIQGRAPTWSSVGDGEVVVSQSFADRFWPGQDPIGRGVRGNGGEPPFYRVVGVAGDVRADGLDRPPEDAVYFPLQPIEGAPLWSPPRSATIVVSSSLGDPSALAALLRREISTLDPEVPLADVRSVEAVIARTTAHLSFATTVVSAAAALALLLAAVGIYSLLAYLVDNRKEEIGVRMALGATSPDVLRMVLGRSLLVTGIGLALGLAGNLLLADALSGMLFEVEALDPITLVGATCALLAIAAAASLAPARRATSIDPVAALRAE